jgi:site-specific recombinase XerD
MKITLSQAIDGFILEKEVAGLSPNTIRNYRLDLGRLSAHFEHDPPLASITTDQVRAFLASLNLSNKTVLNYHTGLA